MSEKIETQNPYAKYTLEELVDLEDDAGVVTPPLTDDPHEHEQVRKASMLDRDQYVEARRVFEPGYDPSYETQTQREAAAEDTANITVPPLYDN